MNIGWVNLLLSRCLWFIVCDKLWLQMWTNNSRFVNYEKHSSYMQGLHYVVITACCCS